MNEEKYIETLLDIPEEVYEVEFTPMAERLIGTDLEKDFYELREKIGEDAFQKYFNVLINIKRYEKDMMMVTFSENHSAIITREYYQLLREVFNVKNIRIVVQSK